MSKVLEFVGQRRAEVEARNGDAAGAVTIKLEGQDWERFEALAYELRLPHATLCRHLVLLALEEASGS